MELYAIFASQMVLVIKNQPANALDVRDMGSIPGSGRASGGGDGIPFQCSCLGNRMDRGAWCQLLHLLLFSPILKAIFSPC